MPLFSRLVGFSIGTNSINRIFGPFGQVGELVAIIDLFAQAIQFDF